MFRATLCLLLIIGSMLTILPSIPQHTNTVAPSYQHASTLAQDPDGAKTAFNLTYTHFDLYTRADTTLAASDPAAGNATWFSRFTNSTGSAVNNTAFRYRLPANPANASVVQSINYTLNIPQGATNVTETFLTFRWNGTLGAGTTAQYRVYNGTGSGAKLMFRAANFTQTGPENFTGVNAPFNATGANPFSCSSREECILVKGFIGFNLTLTFQFNSTATGGGIDVEVDNIIVASMGTAITSSSSHSMTLNTLNQTRVEHTARLPLVYNSTVTYRRPNTSVQLVHNWHQILATFFFPTTYALNTLLLNTTQLIPGTTPIFQGRCLPSRCTNATFISLNMTNLPTTNSTIEIKTISINALDTTSILPLLSGSPTDLWMPGDTVSVRMKSRPGVNVSAIQTLLFTDPQNTTQASQTFTNKGGTYVYNVTIPGNAPVGAWNITATFLSGYDLGQRTHPITVEQINQAPITITGTAGKDGTLTVRGNLAYKSTQASARAVNVTAFVVDAGSTPGPTFAPGTPSSTALYVSNITLANGVFTRDKPLIIFFTVTNPTLDAFAANITIEHEWHKDGGEHGVSVTFPLELGDQPFILSRTSHYRMDVTLTLSGVRITVQSLAYNQKVTHVLSPGASGVPVSRQHFGSFKISITSKTASGSPTTTFSRSPTYAYILDPSLRFSRLLAFNSTITDSNGDFSVSISSDRTLGAKNLAALALARDTGGVGVGQDQIKTVRDSTILTSTADTPSEVTRNQLVTIPFHIRNNSTLFPVTLTVNLNVSASATFATRTFTVQPGSTHTENFDFTAPSSAGPAFVIFSSPQYGPLLTKTLQVSILPGSLQLLIPAIIGLVAAIVILGAYLIRRRPETEMEEETKPKSGSGKPKPQPTRNP